MDQKTRQCQNCKQNFTIEPDDFAFYEKIKVPPPTWCPECRMMRRLAFRNERMIRKRTCDLCGKSFIGMFPQKVKFPVYCYDCWWSDKWDPFKGGTEYDFNRSFFEQFQELRSRVPRPGVNNGGKTGKIINSPYINCAGDMKNCYLVFGAQEDENCMYSHFLNYCNECVDILYGSRSERCYECFDIEQCYNVKYSQSSFNCRDSFFLYDCKNCSDCVGCIGLRNQKYRIFNNYYPKEEYFKKLKELNFNSKKAVFEFADKFYNSEIFKKHPRKVYHGQLVKNSTGDYINECDNSVNCFYGKNLKDCKNVFWGENMKDCWDYFAFGDTDELAYECVSGGYGNYNCKFSEASWTANRNIEYCANCFNCENVFGCISLRKQKYCILNKPYSENDYKDIVNKIKNNMLERGEYGEFFPLEISPFAYHDSVAQEHFPLIKEQVMEKKYVWYEPEERAPKITLNSDLLPDSILDVEDGIINEIIGCKHAGKCEHQCTIGFKITSEELAFYKSQQIPLPTLCFQCRHAARVALRNPLKLWHRQCMCDKPNHGHTGRCFNEFETSYSPDRPEIIYCENCYQQETA